MSLNSLRKKVGNFIAGEESATGSRQGQQQQTGAYNSKNHTPLPVDPYPYPGLRFSYHFVTVDVTKVGTGHDHIDLTAGRTTVSSDITSKYGQLSEPYTQGFILETFKDVPGVGKIGWNAAESPFQAIFSRPYGNMQVFHSWQLIVVKSSINTFEQAGFLDQLSGRTNDVTNKSSIVSAIAQQSSKGGRLVCVELTGQKQSQGVIGSLSGKKQAMGCDVFFNLPHHPNPVLYTYQLINVPVQIMYLGPGKMVKVTCEWMQHFAAYLQQGWRLTEIFWDQGKRSHGDFSLSGDHNSVWFFEKESVRVNDRTPVYNGLIIEYKHTVKIGFFQTKAKGDWGPMISEMGSRGWELACMLETPEVTSIGLGTMTFKVLFFFQRRIVHGQPPPQPHYPPPPQGTYTQHPYPGGQNYAGAPPPPYAPPQGFEPPPPYNPNHGPGPSAPSAPPLPEKY